MSDEYGDTAYEPMGDSQTSDYGDYSDSSDGFSAESGDIDDYEPERDNEGNPNPVPYDRFKQSRAQLRSARDEINSYQGRVDALESRAKELQEYAQWAYGQLQGQGQRQQVQEQDEFLDPLEQRVRELEVISQNQKKALAQSDALRHENAVRAAEREIRQEIDAARSKYKWLNDRDILEGLQVNPRANVMELAKRSHKNEERKAYDRARDLGLRPKPRPLQQFGIRGPVKPEDIGEDLDKAEAAAIEYLLNSN